MIVSRAPVRITLGGGGTDLPSYSSRRGGFSGLDGLSAGHDDGSGILMGQSVGAAAIHMDELFATLPIYPPEAHVKGILVNEQGQRFINEDAYPGRIAIYCMRQIGDRIFLLVDHALFEQPTELSRIEPLLDPQR